MKSTEKENRDYLIKELNKQLNDLIKQGLMLEAEVPVPYKHIYLPNKIINTLEIWCIKQDICLFKELFHKDIKYRDASIVNMKNYNEELLKIKLEKDSSQNSHHVGIPYVIIETKMASNINTHELLAYSEKVQMIKTIFPYAQYTLLFFGKPPSRAYRHGVNFDSIDYIEDLSNDSIKKISIMIEKLYNISIEEIRKIMI
ncbi:MAG: hypothetical protein O8C61_00990 [Candidatus Methanoperedens sp.]|nr:hypothetical protein [Candidatus Methanoperedens sp.]